MWTLKINVDASVYEGDNCYAVGMVVRDHTGVFLGGKKMKFEGCVSVWEAESVGVLEAVLWTRELPAQPIIMETDSLLSVNAIIRPNSNRLELGLILEHIRDFLDRNNGLSIAFVRKQANKVAHKMARLPCMLNTYNIIMSPPVFLLETILYDSVT